MKRLIAALLCFASSGLALADGSNAISSFTLTNDSALITIPTSTTTVSIIPHQLTAVLVSSPSAGGLLKIFNSTYTANTSTVAIVSLGTVAYYPFFDIKLKGLFYISTGNVSGVSIIYKP